MGTRCSWGEYKADGTSVSIIVKEPDYPHNLSFKGFQAAPNRVLR